jgi:hypothetical protein
MKRSEKIKRKQMQENKIRRIYNMLVGLLIFFSLISSIGGVYLIISGQEYDLFVVIVQIIIFLCFSLGLLALFKINPPFHHLIHIGALINGILSFFTEFYGYVQLIFSILILYFGLRFPPDLALAKKILGK